MNKVWNWIKSHPAAFIIPLIYFAIVALRNGKIISAYFVQVVILSCINVILTEALNLVNGLTGQSSLGHAGFMAAGGYFACILSTLVFNVGSMGSVMQSVMFVVVTILGGLFAALCGLVVGVPTLRLKGDYLAVVTLGFNEVIRVIIRMMEIVDGARGFSGIPKLCGLGWTYIFTIIVIYACRNFMDSSIGRGCMAVRDNEIAADNMGINPAKYKIIAFVTSAFIAGIAGSIYGHTLKFLHPDVFAYSKSIDLVVYLYAGGVGSISGAMIGAVSLTVLPELMRFLADWRLVIYGALLVVIILFRQTGIFGGREFSFLKIRTGGIKQTSILNLFRKKNKLAVATDAGVIEDVDVAEAISQSEKEVE